MRIVNYNVNGLRSAVRKGFLEWVVTLDADIICLQETRLSGKDTEVSLPGYHTYYAHAQKPGYSGVALWTKRVPDRIITDWGYGLSNLEGRYLAAVYGPYYIASIYMPSGTSGDARQSEKYQFMNAYLPYLRQLQQTAETPHICIAGDWNIAHTTLDIKNWKSNQDHTGFLPEERAWLDVLFKEYKDAFRVVNNTADQYTWWSNRGRARENNVGWRIDYQVVSPTVVPSVRAASIYKETWFSDHAPLIMDYDLSF